MAKNTYTPEQRDEALRLYQAHGPAEASLRTGIPRGTISKWASRRGLTCPRSEATRAATDAARLAWASRRGHLADELGDLVAHLVQKARNADAADARNLLVAVGIGVEKCELLTGGSTSRVDHSGGGVERVKQLRDEIAARRRAKEAAGDKQ